MATITRTLTYEEWLQMPTVEYGREEVVNGELLTMALLVTCLTHSSFRD